MATGNDIIEEVNRLLLSGTREEINQLNADVTAGATTLVFKHDLGSIRSGSLVDIDLETYRVWSTDVANRSATVQPAMNGSTSSLHLADTLVYVNPRMNRSSIFKALNNELMSLSGNTTGLFQMKKVEFVGNGARENYDLASDALDIYEVRQSIPGPQLDWDKLIWKWHPDADPATFPSGVAVEIVNAMPGRPVQVLYRAPFTPLTSPDQDLLTDAGMGESMQDIPALGILLRLGPVREIKRSFTESQGDSRRAEEVGANNVLQSFSGVRQLYRERVTVEAARLVQKYPVYHR